MNEGASQLVAPRERLGARVVGYVPTRVFHQGQSDATEYWIVGVSPGHGFVAENTLFQMREGRAVSALILQLRACVYVSGYVCL